jgi:C1A family cysteine protease
MIHSWIEMEITELQLAIYRILQKEMEKLLILYVEKNQKSSKQKHLKMAKEMKMKHELHGKVPSEVSSTSKEQSMETHEVTTDEILLNVEEAKEEEDSSDEIHRYQHILKEILRILLRNR